MLAQCVLLGLFMAPSDAPDMPTDKVMSRIVPQDDSSGALYGRLAGLD
jgi:hypothetical protein